MIFFIVEYRDLRRAKTFTPPRPMSALSVTSEFNLSFKIFTALSKIAVVGTLRREPLLQRRVRRRKQSFERQIFRLGAQRPCVQRVRHRRVNLHRSQSQRHLWMGSSSSAFRRASKLYANSTTTARMS